MFEFDQQIVDSLLSADAEFRFLHERHTKLKNEVHAVEEGKQACDEAELGRMKKEKLQTKDRMASLIAKYRQDHEELATGTGNG